MEKPGIERLPAAGPLAKHGPSTIAGPDKHVGFGDPPGPRRTPATAAHRRPRTRPSSASSAARPALIERRPMEVDGTRIISITNPPWGLSMARRRRRERRLICQEIFARPVTPGSKSRPVDLRGQRRRRQHGCWDHLIVAPLWVAYDANLGTLLRTCDAVGACMAVPDSPHYRRSLAGRHPRPPSAHPLAGPVEAGLDRAPAVHRSDRRGRARRRCDVALPAGAGTGADGHPSGP